MARNVSKRGPHDPLSPTEIARRYRDACRAYSGADSTIGSRSLKRKTVPPYARPNTFLKREIYKRACSINPDRHVLRQMENRIRHRDEQHVVRLTEASVVDWIVREVNWHPVRATAGFPEEERVPLLPKAPLSHMRTELNFAYLYAIQWQYLIPFIYMVGGFEVISARKAHDGYPLFDQSWLTSMQGGLHSHPNHKNMQEAWDRHLGTAKVPRVRTPKDDDHEWDDD